MVTAATLFSGIGAPEVAMPGWHWAWHAEIEKFPSAVTAARHPNSINLGDVSAHDFTERAAEICRPDVLVFGSPCQSFSIAGKRLGLDDPRGNLALVALGIVDRLKPRWFVFENVPGLLSSGEGRDFGAFVRTVADIGYHGCWDVLDAQWFGVAQRRQRVFFVGNSRDWRHSAAVLLEPESLHGDHPPRRQAGESPAPTIASRPTGGGGLGADFDCDGGLIAGNVSSKWAKGTGGPAGDECYNLVTHAFDARQSDVIQYGDMTGPLDTDGHTHGVLAMNLRGREEGARPEMSDVASLRAASGGSSRSYIAFSSKDHGADAMNDCAPTLRAGTHDKSHANAGVPPAIQIASAVRRLTPRECERLQGFPDDYTAIKYRKKPAADGPRYKALGNSMAVPVVRWILNRIEMLEQLSEAAE
jgi:DNA (cytosine-5)-methyltransferase 1